MINLSEQDIELLGRALRSHKHDLWEDQDFYSEQKDYEIAKDLADDIKEVDILIIKLEGLE